MDVEIAGEHLNQSSRCLCHRRSRDAKSCEGLLEQDAGYAPHSTYDAEATAQLNPWLQIGHILFNNLNVKTLSLLVQTTAESTRRLLKDKLQAQLHRAGASGSEQRVLSRAVGRLASNSRYSLALRPPPPGFARIE